MKAKRRQEAKQLKSMQQRRMEIKASEQKAKTSTHLAAAIKWAAVRQ